MATDNSTNLQRITWFIQWATNRGWNKSSIRGAAANACAESHAWYETGDSYAPSKYFDYCVYGGDSVYAGYDWYSQGQSVTTQTSAGAVGFFQFLVSNNPAQATVWDSFFSNGNTQTNANTQLAWWFGASGTGAGAQFPWTPGGDVSYTDAPNANSNVSFSEWAINTNNETEQGQAAIFYANLEGAGAGQWAGHTISNLDTVTGAWGINWTPSGQNPGNTAETGNKQQFAPCTQVSNSGTRSPGASNATGDQQGVLANGPIPCLDTLVSENTCVGDNNTVRGQCYGLAQWWFEQCGGGVGAMQGGSVYQWYASYIPEGYSWGTGAFSGFTVTMGSSPPTGGWQTGDIVAMTNSGAAGHVIIVGQVANGGTAIMTWYEQNNIDLGAPCGTGRTCVYNTNGPMLGYYTTANITGTVRPSKFPTCATTASAATVSILPFANATMNAIDISSAQTGINFTQFTTPPDAVIIKVSQGNTYTDPNWQSWANTAQAHGQSIGFYHYLDGSGAYGEAMYFLEQLSNWSGHGVLFADWESSGQGTAGYNPEFESGNTGYLKDFLDSVKQKSNLTAGIYCSISVPRSQDFSQLTDYPLWYAQYADSSATGWQTNPWNDGLGYGSYKGKVIGQQYTDNLQIGQTSGGLDGSLFQLSATDWKNYATAGGQPASNNSNVPQLKDPCGGIGLQAILFALHNKQQGKYK